VASLHEEARQVGAPPDRLLIGDHVVQHDETADFGVFHAKLLHRLHLPRNDPVQHILPKSLHNVALGDNLLPVAGVCRVAEHQPKRNVLTAVKKNVGDAGAFPRASLAKKRHCRVVREIVRAALPVADRSHNCVEIRLGSPDNA
jgi:hypothetical protein